MSEQRVAVVTGGARGIGLAIATRLAADGMRVAVGDIDAGRAVEAAEGIDGALGGLLDVADPESFEAFVARVDAELGPVEVLVNNAGIMPIGPFLDHTWATAGRTVDINVHGPINGARAVLPGMLDRGRGHIVNIASTAGKVGTPGSVLYSASKHAVVGFGDALRQEYAARGIRVTTVLPSFTNTDLISGTRGLRGVPTVEPDDVAEAVARALSKRSATVYVPGMLRGSALLHDLLPAKLNDLLARAYGADRVFLEIDPEARRDYNDRIDNR